MADNSDGQDTKSSTGLCSIGPDDQVSPVCSVRQPVPEAAILAAMSEATSPLLETALRRHRRSGAKSALTLLVPPCPAPELDMRKDGAVTAFLASGPWRAQVLAWAACPPVERCYRALTAVLSGEFGPIELRVVDQAAEDEASLPQASVSIDVVMPHRGDDRHLRAALSSLMHQTCPGRTILCFDQLPAADICRELALHEDIALFGIEPNPAGPYVPRQHFALTSSAKYLAFQDSDDFSLPTRLETLLTFAEDQDADIVGCHELRCDELTRTVEAIRYPLDANVALSKAAGAVQLFPTSIARVDSLRRLGGFSTVRTFGADRQFQLRAYWSARMLNVDAFLYVRRLRAGSLTTSPMTGMSAAIRQEINRGWKDAFNVMKEGGSASAKAALEAEHTQEAYIIHDLRTGVREAAVLRLEAAETIQSNSALGSTEQSVR